MIAGVFRHLSAALFHIPTLLLRVLGVQLEAVVPSIFHADPKALHQFLTTEPPLAGYFWLPDSFLPRRFTRNNFHQSK